MNNIILKLKINYISLYICNKYKNNLFYDLKNINSKIFFLIGIGRQNLLSKIGKFLLAQHKAHDETKISYNDQLDLINKDLRIINKSNVFHLTDIFYCSFK